MNVKVQNFQSLANVEFEAEGLTVLVGPSDVGKSALIRAISAALFGLAGDFFVRKGKDTAKVILENVPSGEYKLNTLVWEKGKGTNRYTVNGELYQKVGTETPVHLASAGFKEVKIKDDYMRPQVSSQFDRIFLLDKPGSYVSDVLLEAHRIGVLTKADRACSTHLKQNKSLLAVRNVDLDEARAHLIALDPVIEFNISVKKIRESWGRVRDLNSTVENLRNIVNRRKILEPLSSLPIPVYTEFDGEKANNVFYIKTIVSQRPKLLASTSIEIPDEPYIDFPYWDAVDKIRELVENRKKLSSVPLDLPPIKIPIDQMVVADQLRQVVMTCVSQRYWLREEVRKAQVAIRSLTTEEEMLEAELAQLKSEMGTCPICDQPMPVTA